MPDREGTGLPDHCQSCLFGMHEKCTGWMTAPSMAIDKTAYYPKCQCPCRAQPRLL